MICGHLLAQFGSPSQRIDAVQTHFSGRGSAGGLNVILATAIIAVLLCGVLVLLNRIQRNRRRREEELGAERRRQLTAHYHQGPQLTHSTLLPGNLPGKRR